MWHSTRRAICACVSISAFLLAAVSQADIVKGPFTFDDNAFVDQVLGTGGTIGGALSGITDTSLVSTVTLLSSDAFIDLAFTDNVAVNGPGIDIVIFERVLNLLANLPLDVTIGSTQTLTPGSLLLADGKFQRAVEIDLTDFGFAAGAPVSTLRISRSAASGPFAPGISGVAALTSAPPVPPVVLVIDEDSVGNGNPPNFFSDVDVNDDIADIGLRTQLPFFAANVGGTLTLYTGEVWDEGWFALKTIPDAWTDAGPTEDGLRNFVGLPGLLFPHEVGPGLGAGNDPEALLDKIPDVTPLRATGLALLVGETVCAVVFDSDISIDYEPLSGSLKGANLGTVAFEVLEVRTLEGASSSSLPEVDIEILDAEEVCERELELFTDAPEPSSGCGIGFELALLLPGLMWLRRQRRRPIH